LSFSATSSASPSCGKWYPLPPSHAAAQLHRPSAVAHPRFSSSFATEVPQDRSARGLHPHVPHERTLAPTHALVLASALLMFLVRCAYVCVCWVLGETTGSLKRRASRPQLPRTSPTASRTAPPPTGALHPPAVSHLTLYTTLLTHTLSLSSPVDSPTTSACIGTKI
jgi:hypothetical protein